MPTKTIAGLEIEFDDDGFMTDPNQWTRDIAIELAKAEGIAEMTKEHWQVIEFIRQDAAIKGQVPTIRRMKNEGGIPTKKVYELFPHKPAKTSAKIAGYPKPSSCV